MDYDVLILGGGIIGCADAYELSKYSLNIALIEKNYDIAEDVALVNSAIVYEGIQCDNSLVAKLELMGNKIFDDITSKLNVPFKRFGSLIIASNDSEQKKLEDMYQRALSRDIQDIFLLDSKQVYEMEPNLNMGVKKALVSSNMGVVCPYDLAIAYGEVAFDNGVNFKLEEEVLDIQKISKGFRVITNKNKFTCKMVVNTTSVKNYSIDAPAKEIEEKNAGTMNYFLLDKNFKGNFSNILFYLNDNGERFYTIPSVNGNNIAAITTKENLTYADALKNISKLVSGIGEDEINAFYQATFHTDPIIIDDSSIDIGYIKVTGKNYGLVTMTPAIAKIVCETIVSNIKCKLRKDFIDKRREFYRFRDLSNEDRKKIIKMNKKYANMVCLCNQITEGEIVEAIRRPLGARTVEGVNRRTGATMGNCQGAYCINKVVSILARETNKNTLEIVKDSKSSKVVLGRIKEFDGV